MTVSEAGSKLTCSKQKRNEGIDAVEDGGLFLSKDGKADERQGAHDANNILYIVGRNSTNM